MFSRYALALWIGLGAAAGGRLPGHAQPLPPESDYRHVHKQAAQDLFAGKAAEAAAWCRRFLRDNPQDAEAWFLWAGAAARMDQDEPARAAVEHAVQAGLPLERFLAGPRSAFAPLIKSPWFEEQLGWQPARPILHGPMLGNLTDHGAQVWLRTAQPATVRIWALPAGSAQPVASAPVPATSSSDFTAVVAIGGLKARTRHHYWLEMDGQPWGQDQSWTFTTAPAPDSPHRFRVAFGGGAAYKPDLEPIWAVMASRQPDLFLALGDNVYLDAPTDPHYQRYLYYRRQSSPPFRSLAARTAVYAIYDDHDFGTDDCSGGPLIEHPSWKRKAWEVFCQNWVNPSYGGGPTQPGCWFRFSFADVDFFMLDGRYYRTNPKQTPAAERSMLGPVQKRWLLESLSASRATFKVLVSGVPWAEGTKAGSLDTWEGFLREREELFHHLAQERIEGILLLSADRHRHDIWKIQVPGLYPLFEFESSKITNVHTHPTMPAALFSDNRRGFGLLEFDTTRPDPVVMLQFIGEHNEVFHRFELHRSQLEWPSDQASNSGTTRPLTSVSRNRRP